MRRIGAHLSIAGGIDKAVARIVAMGGNCLQIFSSSPRGWEAPVKIEKKITAVSPIFIHAKYLINLGSPGKELLKKSVTSLKQDLQFGKAIGAQGVIVHLGSHLGQGFSAIQEQLVRSIKDILESTSGTGQLIIENSAGQQGKICSQLSEIRLLLDSVNNNRLSWCYDTCHGWGAGIFFGKTWENTLIQYDLVKDLVCLHINDSKGTLGGGLDRHENLGEGKMGRKELEKFVTYPPFNNLPLIIETPGFDNKGPDKKNLEILRSLCA
jgi:deoxyribonuclease-4